MAGEGRGEAPCKNKSQANKNLSVFCVAALCGFVEELQEGGPAVWGLVFDHDCAQLGERVLHRVPATRQSTENKYYTATKIFLNAN